MWTKDEIENELKACGIPWAFAFFARKVWPPFCILRMEGSRNIRSDLKVLEPQDTFTLELYYRDPADRTAFEAFLTDHFLWERYMTDVAIGEDGVLMAGYDI